MSTVENVELGPLTTLGVGGPARYFVDATDEPTLIGALEWAAKRRIDVCVLGSGSNVVVADRGVQSLVVRSALSGVTAEEGTDAVKLKVASGESWDNLVALTVDHGWAGLECLSGIPGRVGAAPIQNIGAYGQDVAQTIRSVVAFDRVTGRQVELDRATCRFGYRDSLFKSREPGRYVILSVTFVLGRGCAPSIRHQELSEVVTQENAGPPALADVRRAVLRLRGNKCMVLGSDHENCRSCGSFFLNPVVDAMTAAEVERRVGDSSMPRYLEPGGRTKLSAAWLIERAGAKRGTRDGAVGLSTKHALSLVCHEHATALEVVRFARRIQNQVVACSGILLEPEPVFWGFEEIEDGLPLV